MGFQRNRINRRVIADLKKRSTFGLVFYIAVVLIVFYTYGYYERHGAFSRLYLTLVIGICLFRFFHVPVFRYTVDKYEKLNNSIFLVSVGLTALIWGSMAACFMAQPGEYRTKLLVVVCTAGLSSGGVVAFIPYFRLSAIYNFLMLWPAAYVMVTEGVDVVIGVSFLLFSVYLLIMAHRGNSEYWDALENEFLLEEKSRALKKISRIDVLTGLYNRRHFEDMFEFEWKRSIRDQSLITVMICDIDHFKNINDTHGHLAGDECLKLIAQILKNVFKRETDIIARYGGEEFVVLMTEISRETTLALAEKVRVEIENTRISYHHLKITATISIGVANLTPGFQDKKETLIEKADAALYKAKNEGRNRVCTA